MKTKKNKLPKMETVALYRFKKTIAGAPLMESYGTDLTTPCTTASTTTHF